MKTSNRTLIDLGKVSYADFVYRRQGTYPYDERKEKPLYSFNGNVYNPDDNISVPAKNGGLVFVRVKDCQALGIKSPDTWIPVFKAQLTNSHSLEFTGKKAYQLWALYRKRLGIKICENKTKSKRGRPSTKQDKNQPQVQLEFL